MILVWPAVRAKAITIDFDPDQGYSAKGGEAGTGDLRGQPAKGTQWTGGVSGKEASIVISTGDGAGGTDQSAQTQPGTAAVNRGEYTFLPSAADLGGTFDPASSVMYYSFQLKMPTVASAYGTNILRIRIGGPDDARSAVNFGLSDNGAFIFNNRDATGKGTIYFAETTTGGTDKYYPNPETYFTVSGALNYATKTFTVSVDGIPQADHGNANFPFRSNDSSTPAFTLINFAAGNPKWVPTFIDNIVLSLTPIKTLAPPVAAAAVDTPIGENLIKNPSFETPPGPGYFWAPNNWGKNDVDVALDPENPHSGKYSQRIGIRKITGKVADFQFTYRALPLKPGMPLQLRFWTRGEPNMRPIKISLRLPGAPYTTYFEAEIGLTKPWSESVFDFTLPPNMNPHAMLCWDVNEENTFWLDDVSLTELPAQEGGNPLAGNQVKNGSFEVGRDHWYGTFRPNSSQWDENAGAENMVAEPAQDAPNGRKVLTWENLQGTNFTLTSAYFHLRYGHPVSIRFWLKTPNAHNTFSVNLGQGTFPNVINETQTFKSAAAGWAFYNMVVTPKVSNGGTYYLSFVTGQTGKYELDGVSAVEGQTAETVFPAGRVDVGWGLPDGTPPGNLFYPGDKISFPLAVSAPPGAATKPIHLRLVDYREHELKNWDASVPLDAEGHGQVDVPLPSNRLGGFKAEAYLGKDGPGTLAATELLYSVVPHLKPPGQVADSFFGATVSLTPYNLGIAERLGMRWVRLNPPLSTTWMTVENPKGQFNFYTQGVSRAHAMGFHVLGLFTTTPYFYADGGPTTYNPPWYDSYGPADWNAWATYVQKTATAFGPYVQAWEIWNEPNSHFLTLKPGVDKPAFYVKIVQATHQAVDQAGIKAFLIGNVAGGLDIPFTWDELADGGGKEVDAISFHLYNEDRGPEEKQPPLDQQLTKLRTYLNRSGGVPELWVTEGGIWLDSGRSWLDSAEIPASVSTTIADAANTATRTLAGLKAMGIKRFIDYAAFASPSGSIDYRDECCGIIDTNGVPHAAGAAYAAAVYFLEDAQPLGLNVKPVPGAGSATIASFKGPRGPITVVWSRQPVTLGQIPGVDWRQASGFDLMGNPIDLSADTKVTLDPIYLVGGSSATVR